MGIDWIKQLKKMECSDTPNVNLFYGLDKDKEREWANYLWDKGYNPPDYISLKRVGVITCNRVSSEDLVKLIEELGLENDNLFINPKEGTICFAGLNR